MPLRLPGRFLALAAAPALPALWPRLAPLLAGPVVAHNAATERSLLAAAAPLLMLLLMRACRLSNLVVNGDKILYIMFLCVIAPSGALVTQIAQLVHQDAEYASAINVVTTLLCIITMPLMTWFYYL